MSLIRRIPPRRTFPPKKPKVTLASAHCDESPVCPKLRRLLLTLSPETARILSFSKLIAPFKDSTILPVKAESEAAVIVNAFYAYLEGDAAAQKNTTATVAAFYELASLKGDVADYVECLIRQYSTRSLNSLCRQPWIREEVISLAIRYLRFKLDFSGLETAITDLKTALKQARSNLPEGTPIKEKVASVSFCFKDAYILCWQAMLRRLGNKPIEDINKEDINFGDLFNIATAQQLITNADTWMEYHNQLDGWDNPTLSNAAPEEVFRVVDTFITNAEKLLSRLNIMQERPHK